MGNSIQATNKLQELLMLWKKEGTKKVVLVRESDVRILEELCEAGADLNYLEQERGFAIIPSVFFSKTLIQFFVDKGMNSNSRDEEGNTALHLLIRRANYGNMYDQTRYLVDFLLNDLNADPNVTNSRGETYLFAHAKRIVRTEVSFPEYCNAEQYEDQDRQRGNIGRVTELVERGVDVTVRNCDGESVLHKCVYSISRRIIQKYNVGEVDVRTSSWLYSKTPLMVAAACKENCVENCRLLLERGADINARDLQGYTPLHHAVLNGVNECAQFLIQKGADPNAKSASGNDVYDMNVRSRHREYVFTRGATPTKQVEILEILGAMMIIKCMDHSKCAIELYWDKVMDVCKKFKIQPSTEYLTNYQFIRQIKNRPNPEEQREIQLSVMNIIVARLSEGNIAKFWTLLSLSFDVLFKSWYFFNIILNLLSEELNRVEEFASLEEVDFYSLSQVVELFRDYDWLKELVESGRGSKNEIISHVHSIARLSIACFNKLTKETNCNKVSSTCIELYVKLCHVLTLLHSRFANVIAENDQFDENKRLLKKLINLDLRDRNSNSLMHLVLEDYYRRYPIKFESDLVDSLLDDFESMSVNTMNRAGFEPVQFINDWSLEKLVKMADGGAHVDARNVGNGPTTRKVFEKEGRPDLAFHYDKLQCACARILARNLVPYVNRVPKKIVDFINMHI